MVIVQLAITIKDDSFMISVNQLWREDAEDREISLAESYKRILMNITKQIAEELELDYRHEKANPPAEQQVVAPDGGGNDAIG